MVKSNRELGAGDTHFLKIEMARQGPEPRNICSAEPPHHRHYRQYRQSSILKQGEIPQNTLQNLHLKSLYK